jgi:hypothetical protein
MLVVGQSGAVQAIVFPGPLAASPRRPPRIGAADFHGRRAALRRREEDVAVPGVVMKRTELGVRVVVRIVATAA